MRHLKIWVVAAAVLLGVGAAWSDMTDTQVMQTAMELKQQGMSEMDIARQLMAKGATASQLMRMKQQAEKMQKSSPALAGGTALTYPGASTSSTTQAEGLRSLNGEDQSKRMVILPPETEDTKRIFGHDIFRQVNLSFDPQMQIGATQNYELGPGDEVIVDITGSSVVHTRGTITAEGTVNIDNYGPVRLEGLTPVQAAQRLQSTAGEVYGDCQFRVSVGQTRSISVNVMGEVTVPGTYTISAFSTVFHALYMAGGVTELGTLRAIKVYRKGKIVSTVDVYDYLINGRLTGNVALKDGDIIIVGPYDALVEVTGRVKRPMFYEMKSTESLQQTINYAGGFAADAYTNMVRVDRKNGSAYSAHSVKNADFDGFKMADGDRVLVDSILVRYENSVTVLGAVKHPGMLGLTDSLRTVSQAIDLAGGLSEEAVVGRAVLYRMQLNRTLQAFPIDLKAILADKNQDIVLKNEDQLFIPSRGQELRMQKVIIHGEVFHPDTFQYASGESVEDLILRAGGLTPAASTSKVDIARRIVDPKAVKEDPLKTQTYTVALSDSLSPGSQGFLLEPFDEVYVRRSPAYGEQRNVQVRGEILFEGTYALRTQDDRISDLVKQAGGVSSHAYLQGARLIRKMTEEEQLKRDQVVKMSRGGDRDSTDLARLDISDVYFVGIDLAAALQNPGGDEDIVLREGDVLLIPSLNNTVKINGEVLYPNTVSYRRGKSTRYYIRQAGGFSTRARARKTYIIYASGKVATMHRGKPAAGSEVVVPSKPESKVAQNAGMWISLGTTAASLASVIATLITVLKK